MVKQVHGAWLPDREDYLIDDIAQSPRFACGPSVQLKKYIAALPAVRQFRHAVDIGANIGLWSRVMAVCFDRVTAFEPSAECHEAFWLNVRQRGSFDGRVKLEAYGLSNEPGTIKLNTRLRSTGFTRVDPEGNAEVEVRTLDSFQLADVDLIKIDVEGWEHNVVKGGIETIRRCKPVLIVEQKPNNAELHGLKQYGATNLLKKWGAREVANVSGDVILAW